MMRVIITITPPQTSGGHKMQNRIGGIIRKVNERRQRPDTARIADAQKLVGARDLMAPGCSYDASKHCG
jgi:hypothetical protein